MDLEKEIINIKEKNNDVTIYTKVYYKKYLLVFVHLKKYNII